MVAEDGTSPISTKGESVDRASIQGEGSTADSVPMRATMTTSDDVEEDTSARKISGGDRMGESGRKEASTTPSKKSDDNESATPAEKAAEVKGASPIASPSPDVQPDRQVVLETAPHTSMSHSTRAHSRRPQYKPLYCIDSEKKRLDRIDSQRAVGERNRSASFRRNRLLPLVTSPVPVQSTAKRSFDKIYAEGIPGEHEIIRALDASWKRARYSISVTSVASQGQQKSVASENDSSALPKSALKAPKYKAQRLEVNA